MGTDRSLGDSSRASMSVGLDPIELEGGSIRRRQRLARRRDKKFKGDVRNLLGQLN